MQFGSLLETRVKENKSLRIISSVFKNWSVMSNYKHHRLGCIWVLWKSNVRLTPIYKSRQMISCSVLLQGEEEEVFCTFIYASNYMEQRRELWEDLRSNASPLFRDKPWLIYGDFNEILDGEDHTNFSDAPVISSDMRDFQNLVRDCLF